MEGTPQKVENKAESKGSAERNAESTLLDKFREGKAGALARGLALMSLLAFGEGCKNADQTSEYEQLKSNPNLSELQKELPHRQLFADIDNRTPGVVSIGPFHIPVTQALVESTLVKEHLDKLPVDPAEHKATFTVEDVDQLIAELAAELRETDPEKAQAFIMPDGQFRATSSLRQEISKTIQSNPEVFGPALDELNSEHIGTFDYDQDGVLSDEEILAARSERMPMSSRGYMSLFLIKSTLK